MSYNVHKTLLTQPYALVYGTVPVVHAITPCLAVGRSVYKLYLLYTHSSPAVQLKTVTFAKVLLVKELKIKYRTVSLLSEMHNEKRLHRLCCRHCAALENFY